MLFLLIFFFLYNGVIVAMPLFCFFLFAETNLGLPVDRTVERR